MLRSILTCFASSLERLAIQSVDMSHETLEVLEEEYRFETTSATIWNHFFFCSLYLNVV